MQRKITLLDKSVEYNLRESRRARCLRITIHPGGELSATLPLGFRIEQLENFIRQKAGWILHRINIAKKRKPAFSLPKSSRKEYLLRKKEAKGIAETKLKEFNEFYGFDYRRISIRNQKTRWGSCSRKGNLNFNYKIIHLPEKHLDYIIVHELCHLGELNHSRKFWALVEKTIPEYKKMRKEIKNL